MGIALNRIVSRGYVLVGSMEGKLQLADEAEGVIKSYSLALKSFKTFLCCVPTQVSSQL